MGEGGTGGGRTSSLADIFLLRIVSIALHFSRLRCCDSLWLCAGGAREVWRTGRRAVGREGSGDGREWAGHTRERMFFLAIAAAPKGSVGRMGRRNPPPGPRLPSWSEAREGRGGLRSEVGGTQPRVLLVLRGEWWRLVRSVPVVSRSCPPPSN